MVAELRGVAASLAATFTPHRCPDLTTSAALELRGPLANDGDLPLFLLKNVTAGIFAGDRLDVSLRTAPRSSAHVTSPSATKVYSMPAGHAEARLDLRAEAASLLVYGPASLILQEGADFRQTTRLDVADGGRLLYSEAVAFGRTESREKLAFRRFASELTAPGYTESFVIEPQLDSEATISEALGGYDALGTLIALGYGASSLATLRETLAAWPDVSVGASTLPGGGLIVKVLAPRLEQARACIAHAQTLLLRD